MKTCFTRFNLHCCVRMKAKLQRAFFLFSFLIAVQYLSAQCPTPELQCSTYIVSCADSAAQLSDDPGYLPPVINDCGLGNLHLNSVAWPEEIDKCSGPFSHRIFRKWRAGNDPTTICVDTILVVNVNILSDSLICPSGRDTFLCDMGNDPLDSLALRAPMYGIPNVDTFPLLPDGSGEFCGVFVNLTESEWTFCGNNRTVIRTWELHDLCGRDTMCQDTIVLIDTVPPTAVFDPSLNKEPHTFPDFSGMYLTDTIGMSSSGCVGHGIIPYATVTDNCSNQEDIEVTIISIDGGIHHHYNGDEVKTLSVWNVSGPKVAFIYKYKDDCHQTSMDTVVIVVDDRTPAVAACHDAVNLSLTNVDEFTFMKAASMDAESYDNCYIYEILARRTDWQTACGYQEGVSTPIGDFYQQFADWFANDGGICQDGYEFGFTREVPFCCADVGKAIMVEIMVIDQNCNVDKCWGMVYVEDKIVPIIVEPLADVSITCNAYDQLYQTMFENSDTSAIQEAFGRYVTDVFDQGNWTLTDLDCTADANPTMTVYPDGLVDDNCGSSFRERYTLPESGCASGKIKREFIALITGDAGPVEQVFATQWITVEKCPLSAMDIQLLLKDTTIYDCGISYGVDGNVAIETPGPTLPSTLPDCSQYGIGFYDKVFTIVSGEACNKVLRTWCVVDWCDVDLNAATDWATIAHLDGVKTFLQTIKVKDTLPPEITVLSMVADIQTVNCTGVFSSEIAVNDNCLFEPSIKWYLKNAEGKNAGQGIGTVAAPSTPLEPGAYTLLWRVTDACQNTAEQVSNFTISSDAAPSVVGYSSLTAVLTPMDTNNNGINDIGMASVWGKEFNSSSAPPCGGDADHLIYLLARGFAGPDSPVPPNSATSLIFNCDDFISNQTPVEIQFWVKDTMQNTADYANVIVLLEDNEGVCGGGTGTAPAIGLQGNIFTIAKQEIADVKVMASDQIKETLVTTSKTGSYRLITSGERSVMIQPQKDDDHANGISTIDLLRVQRHILGQQEISDPYRKIAADANKDGHINPIDLIQLRKVLIGKIDRLPENTSWRFVDASFEFHMDRDPLAQVYPEYIEYEPGSQKKSHDFIGVKIGDLNGNVTTSSSARSKEDRLSIHILDRPILAGQQIEIPLHFRQGQTLHGLQFALSIADQFASLKNVLSGQLQLTDDMHHSTLTNDQQHLSVSWLASPAQYLDAGKPLITLLLDVLQDGHLSDILSMNGRRLEPMVVTPQDKEVGIDLRFNAIGTQQVVLAQNRPNPFSTRTEINFDLPASSEATLSVFDALGKLVWREQGEYEKGSNKIEIERDLLVPGLLYYELRTPWGTRSKKMMLLD